MEIPTFNDVQAAADRIKGHAIRTPLVRSDVLDEVTGAKVFIKPENLQRTGSFKFRGAYNAVASLSEEQRKKGIFASSSGNHAQGVAAAAKLFGADATILMPSDAPEIKKQRTKALGAEVVEYDRTTQDRDKMIVEMVDDAGGVLVHPYNNFNVIAGQGTTGLEIAEDLQKLGLEPDRILVCTGGGGLTSGISLSIKHHFPDAKIHSVEPDGFDDYRRSLEAGTPIANELTSGSICDAILTPSPGAIGFEINKEALSEGLVVTDEEAMKAVQFAFQELKMVVEPGGAAALAGLLKHASKWPSEVVAITLSGGNIDHKVIQSALLAD